jgi:hypothetical protein
MTIVAFWSNTNGSGGRLRSGMRGRRTFLVYLQYISQQTTGWGLLR